jgi:DNA (cytosine-5)-methyltransferase 1
VVGLTGAYYNEFDPKAAAWLRELIKQGLIAPGEVDERSISDVSPSDLIGFTQCHFFAGIGGWSKALRLAGWPDDRSVWTGSCPCQPFSSAGKGAGFTDERHLWPHWEWLVSQCRPATVFGEQVASKDGLEWFDLVSADLEGSDYAVGASDMCAAGFGASHIRQRLWFVGMADARYLCGRDRSESDKPKYNATTGCGNGIGKLAYTTSAGLERQRDIGCVRKSDEISGRIGLSSENSTYCGMADADSSRQPGSGVVGRSGDTAQGIDWEINRVVNAGGDSRMADSERIERGAVGILGLREIQSAQGSGSATELAGSGGDRIAGTTPIDSPWRDADWLYCRDGKWRAVESGTFPLAHGISDRVVRLRGYGNAIVPQVAAEWIKAVMSCEQ